MVDGAFRRRELARSIAIYAAGMLLSGKIAITLANGPGIWPEKARVMVIATARSGFPLNERRSEMYSIHWRKNWLSELMTVRYVWREPQRRAAVLLISILIMTLIAVAGRATIGGLAL